MEVYVKDDYMFILNAGQNYKNLDFFNPKIFYVETSNGHEIEDL